MYRLYALEKESDSIKDELEPMASVAISSISRQKINVAKVALIFSAPAYLGYPSTFSNLRLDIS
jgi:hypothetical protein